MNENTSETEIRDKMHCLICDSRVGVSTRNSVSIFSKQIQTISGSPMNSLISKIVDKELNEENVHSLVVCKKCFKLFAEYDELEVRLNEIKFEVGNNYKRTISKHKFDNQMIRHDSDVLEHIKKEDDYNSNDIKKELEDNENIVDVSQHNYLNNTNTNNNSVNISKKFLTIPSSDDETMERAQKRKFEAVELDLERLHSNEMEVVEMSTTEIEMVEQGDDVPQISIPECSDQDDSQEFHHYVQEDEPVDAGAIDNSDDSDYQPPMVLEVIQDGEEIDNDKQNGDDTNTAALLEAAAMAEQTLQEDGSIIFNVKLEPGIIYEEIKQVQRRPRSSQGLQKKIIKTKVGEYPYPIVSRDGTEYTCLVCDGNEKVIGDAKSIMAHVKNDHDLRVYICDVCGDDFRKRNELSHHLDEHVATEEGDFQCEVCNRIFSNLRLFRIHKRMHYPQSKLWTCETCGKRYSSKNLLDEHINTHTGLRPYVCGVCNKDFASKYTYRAHNKTHEVVRPRPYSCSQCDKTFLSQQNLTQHERTHTGVKDFVCHLCGKAFGSPHNLEVHSIVHTGYKPFICRTCGKAFARKAEIRDHERTHTGERPYQCEFCGATFSQRSNLQSHKRATHYDDKRYKCRECNKGFKRRRLLDYHVKAVHTGERPFKCGVCDATFVYPEHFKKHRRIHTGEKPFLCEVCGKAFNSRDNRNAHRFVHSDKKPYECLVCGMGFMRKPLLYAHMETQGHLNDTIVVNQPRLTTDDDQVVTFNLEGEMEIIHEEDQDMDTEDTKLYITELKDHHVIIQNADEGTLIVPESHDMNQEVKHLIIDGQYAGQVDDQDEEHVTTEIQEITSEQLVKEHILNENEEYEEIVHENAIQTSNGSYQIVQVTLNNSDGEEQDAWVNLVSTS
ncbi:zinc finger protein 287-like [Chrysoperla carnea]|uniref:zinc finger protein 287-like n=1 Tax=Chrysoperla carnea TaxID=189513 RepID=UPI001D0868E2|nr:zinc finger protein 287-like [Chrysoperla carnea]XP_044730153.1 zinc finger protein 287-like [Chrysoperla carnea]